MENYDEEKSEDDDEFQEIATEISKLSEEVEELS